ncbi:hypothetical protein EV424DRAFT_1541907 [Suillus variegatus]|nr:hypothetical protein EV424DRAFT_1541907 [Suillus variegatus]
MSRNMEPLPFDPLFNRPLLSELLLDRLIPPPDQARSAGLVTQERLIRYVLLMISIIVAATESFLETALPKEPEPYHTSALKGEEWLMELIVGHPQCIRCELGVHAHVFEKLIMELCGRKLPGTPICFSRNQQADISLAPICFSRDLQADISPGIAYLLSRDLHTDISLPPICFSCDLHADISLALFCFPRDLQADISPVSICFSHDLQADTSLVLL